MLYSFTVSISRHIVTESAMEDLRVAVQKVIEAVYGGPYQLTVNVGNELRPADYRVEIVQIHAAPHGIVSYLNGVHVDNIPVFIQRTFTTMLYSI